MFAAGEIVPAFGVVDAIQQGTIECSHTASYYFVGKNKAFAFDTTLPFGLNQRQQNAWIYYGGGLELVREFFKDFGIISFPAGNTGVQMGGWWRKEVHTTDDLKGVKMRIAGLGGEVMARLGAVPQQIAGGDIYPALERGAIDSAEWVGPYDDEKLGFYKVAPHYYFPGWWESNSMYSFYVNIKEWEKLPKEYQAAIEAASYEANIDMMAKYDFKNLAALERLVKNGVKLHAFSNEILKAAQKAAYELYEDEAAQEPGVEEDVRAVEEIPQPGVPVAPRRGIHLRKLRLQQPDGQIDGPRRVRGPAAIAGPFRPAHRPAITAASAGARAPSRRRSALGAAPGAFGVGSGGPRGASIWRRNSSAPEPLIAPGAVEMFPVTMPGNAMITATIITWITTNGTAPQ